MAGLFYIIGWVLVWLLAGLAAVHVVLDNRQPVKTMAWVLVILFLPVVGVVLYIFFGINHRKEKIISQQQLDELAKRSMLNFVEQHDLRVPDRQKQLVELFSNQDMALPFKDNQIDIMTDGNAFFPELLKDISAARHHIHIDIYIFEDDALGNLIADALRDKARQGVKVRIVYDDVGCWRVSHCFFESMREEGIEVAPYLPVRFPSFTSRANYRNHRKLIVIDGKVGYVGGMNIALRYVKWRDTMLRVTGGAVYALQRAFLVDWYFVDRTLITDRSYYPALSHDDGLGGNNCICQLVTSGPTSAFPEIMQGYVRVIMGARRYVYIETPYFLPNEPVLFALKTAALAGVDVRLLCPRDSDARFTEWASRSYLREVAQAGVQVYLYEPAFLHSKVMVSDDSLCICGSVNIDFRSFENNFESSLFIYDEGTALRLKKVIQDDLRHAVSLEDVHEWMSPSWRARLCESFTRLFSPLL